MDDNATAVLEEARICEAGGSGQLLPLGGDWKIGLNPRVRMVLYFIGLIYSFMGVSIVADLFMSAIEGVTSVQRCVQIGTSKRFCTSPVWNETVATLTLMALGSSAPEIMLSLNDIVKRTFVQGKLGASTIVGSAAFNLFVIVAVCINAIPAGESRQIKQRGVYAITALFSIFAIELWEGAVTFLYFPVFVTVCYLADIGVLTIDNLKTKCCPKRFDEEADTGPKTWLEKFKVENFKEEDLDPEEKRRREEEDKKREAARLAKERELGIKRPGETLTRKQRCLRRCCRRRPPPEAEEGDVEAMVEEEHNTYLSDPNIFLLDDDGNPLENEYGIITFSMHSLTIRAKNEEQHIPVQIVRKNGNEGKVTCTYRLEQLSAIPGFDYEDDEGKVQFRDGVQSAEITLTVLPKKRGERSDRFQVVLEEPTGGAEFNPDFDGGEECQRLTVIVENEIRGGSCLTALIDSIVNLDELRQGTSLWKDQVLENVYVGGSKEEQDQAGALDWLNHLIWLPWTFTFALLTPPPAYLGGWICFFISLMHIAWLTIIIGDLAELFGCVANVDDNITAISFVALGTSVPDLFASMTAARQDPTADASIVNVTGSNSVNVFLGIGMPWLLASFYWYLQGTTFAVKSQGMSFSVLVFTCGACVTLSVIQIRRWKFGG